MRIVLPANLVRRLARGSSVLCILLVIASVGSAWGQQTSSVTVIWEPALDPDVTAYRVYFGLQGTEALALFMEVPSTDTSVIVTDLQPDLTYCTEVSTLRGSCESERSLMACATPTNTGPTIIPVSPPVGEQCASRDAPFTIELDDSDSINQSSIVVLVNGVPVTPGISGTGGSLTLTVPIPSNPPPTGDVEIQVTAEDSASNVSTFTYNVRLQPPAPTGVTLF